MTGTETTERNCKETSQYCKELLRLELTGTGTETTGRNYKEDTVSSVKRLISTVRKIPSIL